MKKILLTGSDGYIGTVLADLLLRNSYHVTGLDTGFYRTGWINNGYSHLPSVISCDTRTIDNIDFSQFEAVIHLADLSNDPLGEFDPKNTQNINFLASANLAKKAKQAGVELFIYSSSCSVYGLNDKGFITESSALNPQTEYAKCKVKVEAELLKLADSNFSPVILRNSTVYGVSPRMRFDLVLNNLAGLAWTAKKINLTSDGTPWRPLVHVQDVCQAFLRVLQSPRDTVHSQIFNVGDTQANYQVKDIAQIVAKIFHGCKLTFGSSLGDNRSYRVSFDKIKNNLPGFTCQKTVEDGAIELYNFFNHINLTHDMFNSRDYIRLNQLKHLIKTGQVDKQLYWQSVKHIDNNLL